MAFNTQKRERVDPADLDLADGTITRIAQQKKDLERASVYIDDAFAFGLAIELVIGAGLKKGVAITAERQRELLTRQETFSAKSSALAGLSNRARTSDEVRKALVRKGFAETVVEDTVAGLEDAGLVDDESYARAFVKSRFDGRGYGPARLRQDLQRKGVARSVIDAALEELTETEDLEGEAREQAAKKWRSLSSEEDVRKRKKKTLDFLVRRGFGFDTARSVVDAASQEDDELWEE
ncbi:regulatory protein RecX [Rubrivirga sp.]|uniref:regulatory protein RecX n=1 Tax=Rubrivirga sp. TaxID=1885344 RepID=UPI003C709945